MGGARGAANEEAARLCVLQALAWTLLHFLWQGAALGLFATEVDSSAQARNKAIVQRFLEEVVNQRNPGAAGATCAGDYRWHGGSIGETEDLPAYQSALASVAHGSSFGQPSSSRVKARIQSPSDSAPTTTWPVERAFPTGRIGAPILAVADGTLRAELPPLAARVWIRE